MSKRFGGSIEPWAFVKWIQHSDSITHSKFPSEILIATELATGPRKANNQTKVQIDGTKRLSDSESRGDPGESDSRPLVGIMV